MKLLFSFFLSIYFFNLTAELLPPNRSIKIDSLRSVLDNSKDHKAQLQAALRLSEILFHQDQEQAISYTHKAEEIAQINGLQEIFGEIYLMRGRILAEMGNYTAAIDQYIKAIHFEDKVYTDEARSGWPYTDVGDFFCRIGHYDKAIEFHQVALNTFKNNDYPLGEALALNNIGICYLQMQEDSMALQNFENALSIRQNLDEEELLANSHFHIAEVFLKLGKKDQADSIIEIANQKLASLNSHNQELILLSARLNIQVGRFKIAEGQILECIRENEAKDQEYENIEIYLVYSELERARGQYNTALQYVQKGLKLAKNSNHQLLKEQYLVELKEVYQGLNDKENALATANRLISFKDSLQVSRNAVLVDLMQFRQNLTQQQAENDELEELNEANLLKMHKKNMFLIILVILFSLVCIMLLIIFVINNRRKKSERNFRESHKRLFTIINNTSNIILSLEKDGKIRLINKAGEDFFKKLLGTQLVVGQNLIDPAFGAEHVTAWEKWIKKGEKEENWQSVAKVSLDDEVHYFYKNFSALQNGQGNYDGLIMVGADFSENRKQEMEIKRQKDELKRSNQAKQKMISILAHDLKDTVYSTKALADLVVDKPGDHTREDLLQYFDLLARNFSKTKNLLMGLLSWVKTQTSGLYVKEEFFDISNLVSEVCENLEEKRKRKNVTIDQKFDVPVEIYADKEMIRTIMRNLLSNALKYTHPDSGKIQIYTEDSSSKITIYIADNGLGIEQSDIDRILEMPGRISTPGTQNEIGTGFGLNLCVELLKLHGAKLQIDSEPGKGSVFSFSLPKSGK